MSFWLTWAIIEHINCMYCAHFCMVRSCYCHIDTRNVVRAWAFAWDTSSVNTSVSLFGGKKIDILASTSESVNDTQVNLDINH